MQFAILAQSPREMYQTDRIHPRYFLSRVRVSIRPRTFFIRQKTPNQSPAHRPAGSGRILQRHQPSERRNLTGSLYGFTPGGDLRPRRLWMILLAPQNHPSLRKSYPRSNDPAKRDSVCEAFEKKPLPLALTLLLRYRHRPSDNRSID